MVETWREFQQSVVDDATDKWRTRLEACVRADGDHFEEYLWRLRDHFQHHPATDSFQSQPAAGSAGSFQSHPLFPEENVD